jgi:hypothetical protein
MGQIDVALGRRLGLSERAGVGLLVWCSISVATTERLGTSFLLVVSIC